MNIFIQDDNQFWCYGFTRLLQEVFAEFSYTVCLTQKLEKNQVESADIIIVGMRQGEILVCHPQLKWQKRSLIIVLMEDARDFSQFTFPDCFRHLIIISRSMTMQTIKLRMIQALLLLHDIDENILPNCSVCQHRVLSPQQMKIARLLTAGWSAGRIATTLSMCSKTVFVHKYAIMNKFNLQGDYELLSFLGKYFSL